MTKAFGGKGFVREGNEGIVTSTLRLYSFRDTGRRGRRYEQGQAFLWFSSNTKQNVGGGGRVSTVIQKPAVKGEWEVLSTELHVLWTFQCVLKSVS